MSKNEVKVDLRKFRGTEARKVILENSLTAAQIACFDIAGRAAAIAPHKTGTLRRSHTVTVGGLPDSDSVYSAAQSGDQIRTYEGQEIGNEPEVWISANTPYALYQHEGVNFKFTDSGAQAKWLETTFLRDGPKINPFVEARVAAALRAGGF